MRFKPSWLGTFGKPVPHEPPAPLGPTTVQVAVASAGSLAPKKAEKVAKGGSREKSPPTASIASAFCSADDAI